MKKILVTGSNGLLGQKITQRFLNKRDFHLIASSKGPNRFPEKAGYEYFDLDVTDEFALQKLISNVKPEAIIHTAAMANPDACEPEQNRADCDLLNTISVKYLLSICKQHDIQLIHLSTDFVFDGENGPYTETDSPNPISYYGRSKVEAERILIQSSFKKWAILRTILVYGFLENMSRSNIVLWVKKSLEAGKEIRVVNDQWRSPTLAEDLAEACILTAFKSAAGIFHISGSERMSVYEIAQQVADFWDLDKSLMTPVPTSSLNEVARRPPRTGFLIGKAIRELDFKPYSLKQGLALVSKQIQNFQKS